MKIVFNKIPKIYYVTLSGSNSNNGLTEGAAWRTLTYAVSVSSPVMPGDIIYVKSGSYGNENIVFQKNGLPGSPITVIGYKTTPGDNPALPVNSGSPYTAFSTSEMPTYTGSSRASGTAFYMVGMSYITIKNIQVQTYYRGFVCGIVGTTVPQTSEIYFYNCNCMSLGDLGAGYSGYGFALGSVYNTLSTHIRAHGCTMENCLIVNPGAEALGVYGDNNNFYNVKVYCNEGNTNPLDYFILICGSFNTFDNCEVEGTTGSFSGSHGIGCKSNAEQVIDAVGRTFPLISPIYNKFFNCVSRNIGEGFFVRHRWVAYNEFSRCYAYGTHAGTDGSSGSGNCITIRDGASYNVFDSCYGEGLSSAILFQDTTEDGDSGNVPGHPNNYNLINNCIFYNVYSGFLFSSYDTPSDTGINTVSNCTFFRVRYVHVCARHSVGMVYKNNIYYGNAAIGSGGYWAGNTYSADVIAGQFANCCFYDIQGGMPSGFVAAVTGGISTDPLFVSLGALGGAAPDLHLQSPSPSRDAGVTLLAIANDFEGKLRPYGCSYSIGAYDR
jgi:hypothetical protein